MRAEKVVEVLSSETRRRIVNLLTRRPLTLKEIASILGITPPAALKHMRELEDAGIVSSYNVNMGPGRPRKFYKITKSFRVVLMLTEDALELKACEIGPSDGLETDDIKQRIERIRQKVEQLPKIGTYRETVIASSDILSDIEELLSEMERLETQLIWLREEILRNLRKVTR